MPGDPSLMDNTIYPDLDKLYSALNMSVFYARADDDWKYVNMRLKDFLISIEKIISIFNLTLKYIPFFINKNIKELYFNIKNKDIEKTINKLNELEKFIEKVYPVMTIYNKQVKMRKILFILSIWIGSVYLLNSSLASSILPLGLAIMASAIAFGALISYKIFYSNILVIISFILILIDNIFILNIILIIIYGFELLILYIFIIFDKNIINDVVAWAQAGINTSQ